MATSKYYSVPVAGNCISTTVTSSATDVKYWIRKTLRRSRRQSNNLIVGVGVQWRPSHIRGGREPVATLQLCVGRRCLIFHLAYASSVPNLLRSFLWNPSYTFVGLWNHSDAQKLQNSRHALALRSPLDLRHYVKSSSGESLARASIERIAREVLGFEGVGLQDWISRSNWEALVLSGPQIFQACADAFVAFEIGKKIRAFEISRNYESSPPLIIHKKNYRSSSPPLVIRLKSCGPPPPPPVVIRTNSSGTESKTCYRAVKYVYPTTVLKRYG